MAQLPPDEPSRFVLQVDVEDFEVHPPLPHGQVLASHAIGILQARNDASDPPVSHLGFTTERLSHRESALNATRMIIGFLEDIRRASVPQESLTAPLDSVIPNGPQAIASRHVELRSPVPVASIRSVIGVSLADFAQLLTHLVDFDVAGIGHRAAGIEQALSAVCGGDSVSDDVRGFVHALLWFLTEQAVLGRPDLVLGSDFRAIYRKLLVPQDRAVARVLLLPSQDGVDCVLVQALGEDAGRAVAPGGPTLGAFLASIVHGTGAVPNARHRGVDPDHRKMLVGLNAHRNRLRTMANDLLVDQTRIEYDLAARFNSEVLGAPEAAFDPEAGDEDSWSAVASKAVDDIGRMYTRYIRDHRVDTVEAALATVRDMPDDGIQDLLGFLSEIDAPDYRPELRAALHDFTNVVLSGRASDAGADDDVVNCFNRLLDVLWVSP